jgi:hypothetical protein
MLRFAKAAPEAGLQNKSQQNQTNNYTQLGMPGAESLPILRQPLPVRGRTTKE